MSRSQNQRERRNRGTPKANIPTRPPQPEIVDLRPEGTRGEPQRTTDDYRREQAQETNGSAPANLLLAGLGGVIEELLGIPLESHINHHQGIDAYLQRVEERLRMIEGAIFEQIPEPGGEEPSESVKPY